MSTRMCPFFLHIIIFMRNLKKSLPYLLVAIQQGNPYFGNAVRISRTAGRFHIHDCEFQ